MMLDHGNEVQKYFRLFPLSTHKYQTNIRQRLLLDPVL